MSGYDNQLRVVLNYIKDVLGVENFAPTNIDVQDPSAGLKAQIKPYAFVSHDSSSPQLQEMQNRMINALKMNASDFALVTLESTKVESQLLLSSIVVVFGDEAKRLLSAVIPELARASVGEIFRLKSQAFLVTHSLSDLSTQPQLKKETWSHLQSLF